MIERRAIELGAAAGYLAATLAVSYAIWGPYDGVGYDPAWAGGVAFTIALLVLHVVTGFAIGRWWALVLPVLWAAASIGAEGYDTPVAILIAFGLPFLWLPAVALGVAARRLPARVRARSS